jgi:hypothetical protein
MLKFVYENLFMALVPRYCLIFALLSILGFIPIVYYYENSETKYNQKGKRMKKWRFIPQILMVANAVIFGFLVKSGWVLPILDIVLAVVQAVLFFLLETGRGVNPIAAIVKAIFWAAATNLGCVMVGLGIVTPGSIIRWFVLFVAIVLSFALIINAIKSAWKFLAD